MSSKRRIRRRSCENKIRHETEQKAREHIYKLHIKNEKDKVGGTKFKGGTYITYKCKFCGGFHVGRPDAKIRQSISDKYDK